MRSINSLEAFNFTKFINEHKDLLEPPVCNTKMWSDAGLMVTIIGGPNQRTDYHDDPAEEFFYQIKGNMYLNIMEEEGTAPRVVEVNEGDIFFLPAHVRHSPQRPEAGSIGLVVEPQRPLDELDGLEWYCMECHHLLYRVELKVTDITTDLGPAMNDFYADESLHQCQHCDSMHPGNKKTKT